MPLPLIPEKKVYNKIKLLLYTYMFRPVTDVVGRFLNTLINYLPNFLGGLVIFIIGLVVSSLLKRFFISLVRFFRVAPILERTGLMLKSEVHLWEQVIAEIIRWTLIIVFLIPTLEAWGLSRVTVVLIQLLLYIPNVIIAVVIGFIGIVAANLVADVVKQSIKSVGKTSAQTLAIFAKSVVIFFTSLIILSQLGIAPDLIKILFMGIVAMLAIAGGLAFGLGGQEHAKDVLDYLKKSVKTVEKEEKKD